MGQLNLEKAIGRNQTIVVDSAYNYVGEVEWTRAISLVVTDEASILIARKDGSMIRSAHLTFPRPLVVALKRYVGIKGMQKFKPTDRATRNLILIRDDWTCYMCNEYGDTMEHLLPKSRGGGSTWGNLAVACQPCNELKGDKTPEEHGYAWPKIPTTLVHKRKIDIQNALYLELENMANDANTDNKAKLRLVS